ncbi:MAG: glycogen debranching enzyme N-terminal domain-containing protein [Deltaproteobacteria bacterium]|nr:glycogen debranching enzyme N-terminal domain-containing protein [Deltaproteobacteria bacterium]
MNDPAFIVQQPAPGAHLLKFCGDTLRFSLSVSVPRKGRAWLRTNLGHVEITRREIIREVESDETPLGRDWFDIPMNRIDDRQFQVTLPLYQIGHFEAKCFFLEKEAANPIWPQGPNCAINVEPADTCCANIIYNAFVRQFGPNKSGNERLTAQEAELIKHLDQRGYAVIPASGKFRDLIKELDFIIGELGCRVIQLLPIHPTPTTYGRMGRFGSPFASLSFKTVDPALAEFDPRATPLEQFIELVDAVHSRQAKVILDIAINHTGWAARLHDTHPQWLLRDPEGKIEVPEAWGVRWEDLTRLDYSHKSLWQFMAEIFLTWCRRGVDGFRCDAGYMVPVSTWRYIVATVREQYPETLFFLEGLGGKISVTRDILNISNFNWAYSELFQNYDRRQIESYLPGVFDISGTEGIMVHFAETHDNPRLASRSRAYAKMRTALCALCSHNGAFGFANGVEWFATEKIDVHNSPSLNWGATPNQVKEIGRLTRLLKVHPAFFDNTEMKLIQKGGLNTVVLLRHHLPSGKRLLVIANLDDTQPAEALWDRRQSGIDSADFIDLLTDKPVTVQAFDTMCRINLGPAQVMCLSPNMEDIDILGGSRQHKFKIPERILKQRYRMKALEVFQYYMGMRDLSKFDPNHAACQLRQDPLEYCRALNPVSRESRVICWRWPQDRRRTVMIPPDHFLLILAEAPFRADIVEDNRTVAHEESLPLQDERHFVLIPPQPQPRAFRSLALKLSVYEAQGNTHAECPVLYLPYAESVRVKKTYRRREILEQPLLFLATNGCGAMLRTPVLWAELNSRYDALLAANPLPDVPTDRWIMFTRCRAWVVFQGYSQAINKNCLELFYTENDSRGFWQFHVPTGQGEHVIITVGLEMVKGVNAIGMAFYRHPAKGMDDRLADDKTVNLILRPDIESRNFHGNTKAYTGPEHQYPKSVKPLHDGFVFAPEAKHCLQLNVSQGQFVFEPEWHYMVHHPLDAERGFDPASDLFSPGYFSIPLKGGQISELTARVSPEPVDTKVSLCLKKQIVHAKETGNNKPENMLSLAMSHFVVNRGNLKTVIAGYPWFLDWGRDAMIAVRGMIADGRTEDARKILKQFGQFEHRGTLPNMIRGEDAGNRDTSDAPLWFFVAIKDIVDQEGAEDCLKETCGRRTIREILVSIGRSLISGTPNGIRMDPETTLLFSPAHFTWMDTNHPAGTPRQGYPIEIQALWYAAVSFLARIDTSENWRKMAEQIRVSILEYFYLKEDAYLSDCLHAPPGQSAKSAEKDDALRPNQLFAITLGAIKDQVVRQNVVTACEELLVPGAIRSLADRPVRRPLPVIHKARLLNDPHHPYQGKYVGDEDTQRKPAYHNGTAWTWVLPSFCEAWVVTYGPSAKPTAFAWLASCARLLETGCIGNLPEIVDGDSPHPQRGCDAQAWSISEALRVWKLLSE